MARYSDQEPTGVRKRRSVPATVVEFPRTDSHSGQSEARDFAAPPSALSSTEKALHKELIKTARALAKRGVPGVYAHVADVAEQVSAAKAYGANAIPPLARGIDGLKDKQATHTKLRRDDEAIKYLREEDRKEGGNTYYDEIADLIRDLRAHVLVLEAAQPQNDPDEDVENGDDPAQEAAGQGPHNNGQSVHDNFERFAKPHDLAIEYLRELDIRSGRGSYLDEIACLFEELLGRLWEAHEHSCG